MAIYLVAGCCSAVGIGIGLWVSYLINDPWLRPLPIIVAIVGGYFLYEEIVGPSDLESEIGPLRTRSLLPFLRVYPRD